MEYRICSVEGCESRVRSKDLCSMHYQRWRLKGSTDDSAPRVRKKPLNPNKVCAVEGCEKPVHAKGWCATHHARWWKHGSVEDRPKVSALHRLLDRVEVTDSGCWEYTWNRNPLGYGVFSLGGNDVGAHVAAWLLLRGPIPVGTEIDHLCRNPPCFNPDHLEPVPHKENILRGEAPPAKNARKTHCKYGHPLSGENLYVRPGGGRVCRICARGRTNAAYDAIERRRRYKHNKD